jgi:hypothetical protein
LEEHAAFSGNFLNNLWRLRQRNFVYTDKISSAANVIQIEETISQQDGLGQIQLKQLFIHLMIILAISL